MSFSLRNRYPMKHIRLRLSPNHFLYILTVTGIIHPPEPAIHLAPVPPRLSPTRHILFIYLPHLFSPYLTRTKYIYLYNMNFRVLPISPYRIMKQPALAYDIAYIVP